MFAHVDKLLELLVANKAHVVSALIGIAIGWYGSELIRVSPSEKRIEAFKEDVERYKEKVSEKHIEQIEDNNKKLGNDLQVCQSNLTPIQNSLDTSKAQNIALGKKLNQSLANCSIIKEINKEVEKKSAIQKQFDSRWLIADESYVPTFRDELKLRQISDHQAIITNYQAKLGCESKPE